MSSSANAFEARILIVDDQDSNVRLLELTLRRGGYSAVTSTTEPSDVCALHRQNRYDLMLLDLQMPRMNGYEVLAGLTNEPPVPVLIISADPTEKTRALEAGATDFLTKPFVLAEVLVKVKAMLATKELTPVLTSTVPLLLLLRAVC
jgi:CheY-like chemotaxis protein